MIWVHLTPTLNLSKFKSKNILFALALYTVHCKFFPVRCYTCYTCYTDILLTFFFLSSPHKPYFLSLKLTLRKEEGSLLCGDGSKSFR